MLRPILLAAALLPLGLVAQRAEANFVCNTPDCLLPSSTTSGGGTSYGLKAATAFRVSIGVQWNFGTFMPEVVLAVRGTETRPQQQVYGAQADLAYPINLLQPIQWPTVRLLGLAGNRDFIGQGGVGLQLGTFLPVIAGGLQGPQGYLGANFVLGQGIQPYIGVNAFSRAIPPRRVVTGAGPGTSTSYSCPSGYTLTSVSGLGFPVNGSLQTGGKTCLAPV